MGRARATLPSSAAGARLLKPPPLFRHRLRLRGRPAIAGREARHRSSFCFRAGRRGRARRSARRPRMTRARTGPSLTPLVRAETGAPTRFRAGPGGTRKCARAGGGPGGGPPARRLGTGPDGDWGRLCSRPAVPRLGATAAPRSASPEATIPERSESSSSVSSTIFASCPSRRVRVARRSLRR